MKTTLHVSLGHNSSAVLTRGDRVVRGYEQERIDRRKSSSAYPREAIELAVRDEPVDEVFVGHWFDDFALKSNKYLDLEHLQTIAPVKGLTPAFTHHDSHAQSAMSFLKSHDSSPKNTVVVVLDGFGNLQECLSVYRENPDGEMQCYHRTYGYCVSLGLMYQYATEYLGMKPNRDEYKLLGYEAHVASYASKTLICDVKDRVEKQAREHAHRMLGETRPYATTSGLIDMHSLKAAHSRWWECADRWREMWNLTELDDNGIRSVVAFCAQTFLEECVRHLIGYLAPDAQRLVLVGGCFYNVKLNRSIATRPSHPQVVVNPLAGDQGAALGSNPSARWNRLDWGYRRIGSIQGLPSGAEYVHPGEWTKRASELLLRNRIVNVVRGGMEFGPRALCNTTTFALPNARNVQRINALNERDEAMPMAPVMTRMAAARFLRIEEVAQQFLSMSYMITTCGFAESPPEALAGVTHRDPLLSVWTARPQIVRDGEDEDLQRLLDWTPNGVLINTSFNYHGEPIVFTEDDAIKTHSIQCMRAQTCDLEAPVTLLVRS